LSSILEVSRIFNFLVYKSSGEDSIFEGSADETFSMKLKKFWTEISLGGFASSSNQFYESQLTSTTKTLSLACPKGSISIDPEVTYFGLSKKNSKISIENIQISKILIENSP